MKRQAPFGRVVITSLEDIGLEDESPDQKDPNFKSELAYDGYDSIVDYDNSAFSLNTRDPYDPERELDFRDREQDANQVEESAMDPQEHKRKHKTLDYLILNQPQKLKRGE